MTYLYFIESENRIKIGISTNVERRLRDIGLHLAVPPTLIGFIEGGYALEKHVHGILAEHRLNGEWFSASSQVRSVIARLMSGGAAAVKFTPREPQQRKAFVPHVNTPAEQMLMFKRMSALIWPDDPIGGFAEMAEVDQAQANAWLDGVEDMPNVIRKAFAAVVVQHALSN